MTRSKFLLLTSLFFPLLIPSLATAGKNNTPDWWRCDHKVSGEYAFGRISYACDVANFGSDDYVMEQYSPIVFNDDASRSAEMKRYMQNLYSVVRDAARYYIKTRNPNVSAAEIAAWQEAIYAMVHQETWWTHYRKASSDQRLKMIRGDSGHGHGLVQIDDRWHYATLTNGGDEGWNLSANMSYGFGIIYSGWKKSKYNAACISDTSSWEDRARAAYSAHNAGIGGSCRWATSNDRRDQQFLEKYRAKDWLDFVNDTQMTAQLDIACLMEENSNCGSPSPPPTDDNWDNHLLLLSDGSACLHHNDTLHCLDDPRDAICLSAVNDIDLTPIQVSDRAIQGIERQHYNRHDICQNVVNELQPVGSTITLSQEINQRETAAGTLIQAIPKGGAYQVLDFELVAQKDNDIYRYYRVRYNGKDGYIYAGNKTTYGNWTQATQQTPNVILIGMMGDKIEISKSSGINFRQSPGGELLPQGAIPFGEILTVDNTMINTTHNKIYYQVNYQNTDGWIYGGWMLPDVTPQTWAVVTDKDPTQQPPSEKLCTAGDSFYYEFLRECNNNNCKKVSRAYVIGGKLDSLCQRFGCQYTRDTVKLLEDDGAWSKVDLTRVAKTGWINNQYLICN